MCGAAGSPRTGLRRVGRGGQDPSELASRCAAATGLSCRASRCMSGSASVPAAQLPTAASRCATLQALHTPVHQMWGGAARTPARASTVVDNTCPQIFDFRSVIQQHAEPNTLPTRKSTFCNSTRTGVSQLAPVSARYSALWTATRFPHHRLHAISMSCSCSRGPHPDSQGSNRYRPATTETATAATTAAATRLRAQPDRP